MIARYRGFRHQGYNTFMCLSENVHAIYMNHR